jgi:hypothetical protein
MVSNYTFLTPANISCMRKHCYIVLLTILLSFSGVQAFAGFVVLKHTSVHRQENSATQTIYTIQNTILKNRVQPSSALPQLLYNKYKQNQWYGIAAIISGVLGLFVPGMYLLAILFGLLGIGRKSKAPGLAIAGLAIGIMELALFLITSSVFISLILFG